MQDHLEKNSIMTIWNVAVLQRCLLPMDGILWAKAHPRRKAASRRKIKKEMLVLDSIQVSIYAFNHIYGCSVKEPNPPGGGDGKPRVLNRQPGCLNKVARLFALKGSKMSIAGRENSDSEYIIHGGGRR